MMIALVLDRGDDGGLAVAPAVARDAGLLADARARAVGGDQQAGARSLSPSASSTSTSVVPTLAKLTDRCRQAARCPPPCAFADQRREQRRVLDHVGERLARLDVAVEREEGRPHRVLQAAVGDHHVEDRLRVVRDLVPDADRLEQPPRRRHDGGGARIAPARAERRIGDRDRERRPEPLAQRDRQREAGEAGAADQHVKRVWHRSLTWFTSIRLTGRNRYSIRSPASANASGSWQQGAAMHRPPSTTCSTSSTSSSSS